MGSGCAMRWGAGWGWGARWVGAGAEAMVDWETVWSNERCGTVADVLWQPEVRTRGSCMMPVA
jgi:hypothetical protein